MMIFSTTDDGIQGVGGGGKEGEGGRGKAGGGIKLEPEVRKRDNARKK